MTATVAQKKEMKGFFLLNITKSLLRAGKTPAEVRSILAELKKKQIQK